MAFGQAAVSAEPQLPIDWDSVGVLADQGL